ncbi:SIR4-interacting protein SIF2 [Nakaseomyces bracarensis]|uniref:SIR4-interacting protein SIF2 n=1 Tax=Nakaseomyces bracarensis TaxID=273131 RepID=A0ABR4NY31_9SACH
MSITSEELNYLIWRYLQETGNELTALALQEETRVLEFDSNYKENIPIGTLVNLVQRGILYTESELLVNPDGEVTPVDTNHFSEDFNLVQALQIDREKFPKIAFKGRFELENSGENNSDDVEGEVDNFKAGGSVAGHVQDDDEEEEEIFAETLKSIYELEKIICLEWNPVADNVIAVGEPDSTAKIIELEEKEVDGEIKLVGKASYELRHPFATSATTGKITNQLTCLAWSHDGNSIATAVENGELRLWNREGKLQNVLNFHKTPIVSLNWSASDTHFISTDIDNITILWDAVTGVVLQHFESKSTQQAQSSSNETQPCGVDTEWVDSDKFVIPGPDGSLLVNQINEPKPIGKLVGHRGTISQLQFNKETKLLASASDDNTIRIWHGGNGNSTHCFYGHTQTIVSLQWITKDKLVSASMDGSVKVWSCEKNTKEGFSNLIAEAIVDGVPIFAGTLNGSKDKYAVGFMDGQVTVFSLSMLLKRYEKQSQNSSSVLVLNIPVCGEFETDSEDSVFDLAWKHDELAIAYSTNNGAIIKA